MASQPAKPSPSLLLCPSQTPRGYLFGPRECGCNIGATVSAPPGLSVPVAWVSGPPPPRDRWEPRYTRDLVASMRPVVWECGQRGSSEGMKNGDRRESCWGNMWGMRHAALACACELRFTRPRRHRPVDTKSSIYQTTRQAPGSISHRKGFQETRELV